jgi:signal transduction histidine kinase
MVTTSVAEVDSTRRRVSSVIALRAALAAGVIASAGTAWACMRSPILSNPTATAIWRSAFVASYVAAGIYAYWRRPDSRLGPLVAGVGFLYSLASLNASGAPLAYTLGMVVWVTVIVYLAYVYLCFPRGRLESGLERGSIAALVVSTAVVWTLILTLSPTLPPGGFFTDCRTRCPPNALQVVDGHAQLGAALNTAFNILTTIALIGIALLIFNQARSAAYISRRAMAPLTVAFLANIVVFVMFLYIGPAFPGTRAAFRIAGGLVTLTVPIAILIGQARRQSSAAMSLGQLVVRASREPITPTLVQQTISDALGDPRLQILLWDADESTYVDVDGRPVEALLESDTQRVTRVTRGGLPAAALVHDPSRHADADVAEQLAITSLMLLENWRLVQELRASQARLVKVAERERRRLEQDLHDGAQQSLMGIELRAALAVETADPEEVMRQLRSIHREAEAALRELRELAHGIYPTVLHDLGLVAALLALARRCPIPMDVSDKGIQRYPHAIEAALYFSAREAIQNAVKHAGSDARVVVTLAPHEGAIGLTVTDDGVGMSLVENRPGIGILNMRDRVEAVGGQFSVRSAPGRGTTIRITIPQRPNADRTPRGLADAPKALSPGMSS